MNEEEYKARRTEFWNSDPFGNGRLIYPYFDTKSWLEGRRKYLCASEASDVIGIGFNSNVTLWKAKTGRINQDEHSPQSLELMRKGSENEELSRKQWAIDTGHEVIDGGKILVVNSEILDARGKPFLACTLDSVGIKETGSMYDIELKRSESIKLFPKDRMPDKYRAQVIHQMIVTGLREAALVARIVWFEAGIRNVVEREYWLSCDYPSVKYDMEKLLELETRFWNEYVLTGKEPPLILPTI